MSAEARKHEPDVTRHKILMAAAEEIHLHGYQAAGMSVILSRAGVTKGALYHHFENKQALGYAVLEEVVGEQLRQEWINPIQDAPEEIIDILQGLLLKTSEEMSLEDIQLGCPLNNLALEMSPIDEGFRKRINTLYEHWNLTLKNALAAGIRAGKIKATVDPESIATIIIASLEGCAGMAKQAGDRETLSRCGNGLIVFLNNLKEQD